MHHVDNQLRFQSYFARAVLWFKIHNIRNRTECARDEFGAKLIRNMPHASLPAMKVVTLSAINKFLKSLFHTVSATEVHNEIDDTQIRQ
jgi:hypothetical protein